MKYKASDIIIKARQLSDLTNSDFLTWNEEVGYGLIDAYAAVQEAIKLKN